MKKFAATILLWTAGIVAFALEFGSVIYAHENWPALEAPGAFIFFALGVMLGILSLRAMRAHRSGVEKLAGWGSLLCIGFSIAFAIVHGWADAVGIVYALAALAYFLGVIWFVRQSARRFTAAMAPSTSSALGEPSEQAILADAAEPYILYPAKWKISRVLLILLAVTVVFAIGAAWMHTLKDVRLIVTGFVLVCLAALCCLTCLLLIHRLISRKQALILTHLGLIDRASALSGGVGPVWWDEVAYVSIYTTPKGFLRPGYRYLEITPVDARSILRRQPPIRRFLLRLFSPIPFTWLDIRSPAWILEPSLETVLEQTERYAHESIKRRLEESPPPAMDPGPGE
jgi:hypothetical protein